MFKTSSYIIPEWYTLTRLAKVFPVTFTKTAYIIVFNQLKGFMGICNTFTHFKAFVFHEDLLWCSLVHGA